MSQHYSVIRLQRPSIVVKGALWFFLVLLFFAQQVGVLFASQPVQKTNTQSSVNIVSSVNGVTK